ncbi:MAG TPA: PKD domain-containing protein [Candidatus Thermoplasmatota archaeon]|nr:PKD domain-containing protein [Candidatus Thermoplasmatota archaeon]
MKGSAGSVGGPIDPIGIQQMFQMSDQMTSDLFAGDGFILWDVDSDQNLPAASLNTATALTVPGVRASATDAEGDARTAYGDLVSLKALATATHVVVDLGVKDLSLSANELEDIVEYRFTVNDASFGVCYSLGSPTVYNYAAAAGSTAAASYNFETGIVHVEIPLAELPTATLPATVFATSHYGDCSTSMPVNDDRIPNEGTISTSATDEPPVEEGLDIVTVHLEGPNGFTATGTATLNAATGTWVYDPAGTLAEGTYTATARHSFDDGTGPVPVAGPVSVTFTVGTPDTEAPSAAAGLAVTAATTSSVSLQWTAATDNVAVTGYRVYRSGSPGVTPLTGTLAGTTSGTTFTDTGRMAGATYYYAVQAEDGAGNRGPLSNEVQAVTPMVVPTEESLRLFLDGAPFATLPIDTTTTNPAPWSTTLDTTVLADGLHVLRAVYTTAEGEDVEASVTFAVQNTATITLAEPAAGATVGRTFTMRGTTTGTGGPGDVDSSGFMNADGTVKEAILATAQEGVALAEAVRGHYAGHSGFLAAAPALDGTKVVYAYFRGEAPAAAPEGLVPEGWTLNLLGGARWEQQVKKLQASELRAYSPREGPPVPSTSDGIGPGSPVYTYYKDGGVGLCTANFIWQDQNGDYYLGAAGHCFLYDDTFTATHGPGANYNPNAANSGINRIDVCFKSCILGGAGALVGAALNLGPAKGTVKTLGALVYARQTGPGGDVGNDFGIVKIPAAHYSEVRPHMPVWNGPVGANGALAGGRIAVQYGNGLIDAETFATKARAGLGLNQNAKSWQYAGMTNSGDSGSAVNLGVVRQSTKVLEGEGAIGILTHGIGLAGVGAPVGITSGTTIPQAIAMATEAGLNLRLVKQGEEITTVDTIPGTPGNVVATPGNGAVSLTWTAPFNGGRPITGYTVKYGTTAGGPYSATQAATTPSATVTGLVNGQTYYFVVTATNVNGEGPASAEASATPELAGTVPTAPQNVEAVGGNEQVSLFWDPPASNGGRAVQHYVVRYGETPGNRPYSATTTETSFHLVGIPNGATIYAVVSAVNSVGEGPTSPEVSATARAGTSNPAFTVEVRGLRVSDGEPLFGWVPVDTYDGSSWAHAVRAPIGAYQVTLEARVLENGVVKDTDSVTVNVNAPNAAPVANAGADQSVNEGVLVTLAGAGQDADGQTLTYAWTQVSGPAAALQGASTASATFRAPHVDAATALTFRLTVTDTLGAAAEDLVTVTVSSVDAIAVSTLDGVPVAAATQNPLFGEVEVAGGSRFEPSGAEQATLAPLPVITDVLLLGSRLTASAEESRDVDGSIVAYAWSFGDGKTATGPRADHTYLAPGLYTLTLTVTDNHGVVASTATPVLVAVGATDQAHAAPVVVETYFLHRKGCGTGADNTLYMDRTPAGAQEGGHGCGAPAATAMNQRWTASVVTGAAYPAGAVVQAHVRGFTLTPRTSVVMTGQLRASNSLVATGSATATSLSLALVTTPCSEWVIPMTLTEAVPAGATLDFTATTRTGDGDVAVCYEGGTAASRVSLAVHAEPAPPALTLTGPAQGTVYDAGAGSAVTVTGTATFPANGASRLVQVSIGDATFAANPIPVTGTTSWTATWNLENVPAGAYTVYARAVEDGRASPAKSVGIVVVRSSGAPAPHAATVEVQVVRAGTPVTGTAWTTVEAYDAESGAWAFPWDTTALPRGAYDFHARLVDNGVVEVARTTFQATLGNNHAPVILGAVPAENVTEGSTLTFTLAVEDIDGDTLTWSGVNLPAGATLNAATGAFTWTPGYTQAGVYDGITLTVSDGELSASLPFRLTVVDSLAAPVFDAVPPQAGRERAPLAFTVKATDPEGMAVTYRAGPGVPAGVAVNAHTGEVRWTPTYEQAGNHSLVLEAVDADGVVGATTVQVTILDVMSPVLNTVSGKGYDTIAEALAAATAGDVVVVRPGTYRESLVLTVPGITVCGTQTAGTTCATTAVATLAPASGVPVQVRASGVTVQGFSLLPPAGATSGVLVAGTGAAPLAGVTLRGLTVDTTVEGAATVTGFVLRHTTGATVLGNRYVGKAVSGLYGVQVEDSAAARIEGNSLANAGIGVLLLRATAAEVVGNAILGPATTTAGADTVAVSISLGSGHRLTGNTYTGVGVGLAVLGSPDVQSRDDRWRGTGVGIRLRASQGVQPQGFLVNNGQLPEGAQKLVLEADTRNILVDARYNYWGGVSRTSIRAASIRDQGVNNVVDVDCFIDEDGVSAICPPEVQWSTSSASPRPNVALGFLDGTKSGGRQVLTYQWTFGDGATSMERNPTHAYATTGSFPVTLTVTDAEGYKASRTERVTVTSLAPVFEALSDKTVAEGQSLAFAVKATDPEGDAVTLAALGLPRGAAFNANGGQGSFHWVPGYDAAGEHVVTFRATDAHGTVTERLVKVTVTNVDLAPVARFVAPTAMKAQDALTVTDLSRDPDGGAIVARLWTFGDGATATTATATHTYAAPGKYTVTLTVTDDEGATASFAREVLVDGAAPATTATLQGTLRGNVAKDTATVKIAAADELSGLRHLQYRLDGGEVVTRTSDVSLVVTAPGHHVVEYWATDVAGHVAAVKRLEFAVDAKAPETTIVSPQELAIEMGPRVLLEASVVDAEAGVRSVLFLVDGVPVATFDQGGNLGATVAVAPGVHTFAVLAIDWFGHESVVEERFVSLPLGL